MTISSTMQENQVVLKIDGRVDTNTSPQLQSAILDAFQRSSHIVLDFEKVPYISSAGLRALLIGQKAVAANQQTMVLRNVSEEIMEVFDMTGFSDILTIEEA